MKKRKKEKRYKKGGSRRTHKKTKSKGGISW